ncbi:SDR family oxidoreductase [Cereibacter azotoformans]|uniref:SDR family oxidoreductase n=1 Tax=Cereibacter azotoformans TaxID=43057 RepID=UPI001EEB2C31|nr:SDR family oxidoreductase [Cereibacter azotoformans]ULB10842.1 SDR family oxidoreductase [Cereibacter azotoformans]
MATLQGKVVAITGASRGIGAAAVRVFSEAGARVALLARSADEIEALAAEAGHGAFAIRCDVADWEGTRAAIDQVVSTAGRIDVLINNAGVIEPIARMADADPAAWASAIDINLKGVFHGMRAAVPHMRGKGGTIITVSSGAAQNALEGWSAYCSSKAGAAMLTRCAHLEEAVNRIRIMSLSPGTVATEMQDKIRESGVNPVSRLDPSAHIPADWPARALLWMCGPGADRWLGQEISLRDESIRRAVGLGA